VGSGGTNLALDAGGSAGIVWRMRDYDVRVAVRAMLLDEHAGDCDTRIVEEMGIWSGSARIDIAVINGQLTGYELKSDSDTLDRLPAQAELYSRVFDEVCLVVGSRHASEAKHLVPRWWGVIVATGAGNDLALKRVRKSKPNPKPDRLLVARLLWRDEALAALEAHGLAKGWRSKSAPALHERLASELSHEALSAAVRAALKQRSGWLGQPVSDKRKVSVGSDLNPSLAAAWSASAGHNLLDSAVAPTTR
jgi:hypothetical protein